MPRVLIAGVSTRAAAESAVRAGYDVVALDAYGDLDQPSKCHTLPPGSRWGAAAAARCARELGADAAVYGSDFENHPRAVAALAATRRLWGNTPDVLRRVRDPATAGRAFRAAGLDVPDLVLNGARPQQGRWLLKPLRSGGGARVRRWRAGALPRGDYAQSFVDGEPGSVVFVAAGGRATVLAVCRQLAGDPAFGAKGFRY
jgi:predicted ATP-grasp superfamily ATP-dependent carboligase